ncbi:MAG: SPFH domain-containing protein, partial [Firmicutes bacterium]|nr:SPFH domain-containing protein [Bacillota bacterium]
MYRETIHKTLPGLPMLAVLILALLLFAGGFANGVAKESLFEIIPCLLGGAAVLFLMKGFFMVNPNEGVVLQLFGRYKGTTKTEGLMWANPLFSKRKVSLRVRNFESSKLKVNDLDGNPIEIGAVVTWKVVDTAEAVFNVDAFEHFVNIQSEAALR